jgi:FkbM family methyltransferase
VRTRLTQILKSIREIPVIKKALIGPLRGLQRVGVTIPHSVYQHVPFRGVFEVKIPQSSDSYFIESHGHSVENELFWRGFQGFEPECLSVWVAYARQSRVVLDIGANTGTYALTAGAVSQTAQIVAFEPVARIAELARKNVRLNSKSQIEILQVAVGALDGRADIFDPGGDNAYSASLNSNFLSQEKNSYPVDVVSIDRLVAQRQWTSVDLVKLDVEGYEEFALAGMRNTIERWRPTFLLEFLNDRESHRPLVEKIEWMLTIGYQLYQLEVAGIRLSSKIEAAPEGGYNVLLTTPDKIPRGLRVLS